MANFRIDLATVDAESFNITEKDGLTLIAPTKAKHSWTEHELHLRSLLIDKDGCVVSAGFPKFFNYSEKPDHDLSLLDALATDSVTFSAKEDGSLIIGSQINGEPHLRTRGSHDLGVFSEPVCNLIRNKYPAIMWLLKEMRPKFSVLFEYTAPTNQVVLKYPEPSLHYLGIIDLTTLQLLPHNMIGLQDLLKLRAFPPPVVFHELPEAITDIVKEVRSWTGKEGVVARIVLPKPDPYTGPIRLLKIKADLYLKLHALKYRLGGKMGKLAFLLGIESLEEAPAKLEKLGIDFEAQQFIMPELTEYVEKLLWYRNLFTDLTTRWEQWKDVTQDADPRLARKKFVEGVKESISIGDWADYLFPAAMSWYSGKEEEAWLQILASEVLNESPVTVKLWARSKQAVLDEMLNQRVPDDES